MQSCSRRWMAVWLGAGLSAACDVSIEEIPGELGCSARPARPARPAGLPQGVQHRPERLLRHQPRAVGRRIHAGGGRVGEDSAAAGVGGSGADDSALDAGAAYVFARSGATWHQAAYVKAGNPEAHDCFGYSLALSADGSTLAVGAPYESSAATGIDGDQGNTTSWAGAVYVLARSGATWRQEAYVEAGNTGAADLFGGSVALSADGSILAVGARARTARRPASVATEPTTPCRAPARSTCSRAAARRGATRSTPRREAPARWTSSAEASGCPTTARPSR